MRGRSEKGSNGWKNPNWFFQPLENFKPSEAGEQDKESFTNDLTPEKCGCL